MVKAAGGGYGLAVIGLGLFFFKYLKYGVNTISEFWNYVMIHLLNVLSPFYLSLPMSYLSCLCIVLWFPSVQ